jgi:hypothetical protein
MAITATEIEFHLSGGTSNTDPNASLGGAIATQQITDASLHNLFDQVSGDESSAGDIEYRCIYVKNSHGSLTWESVVTWIETNTPAAGSTVDIGLGTSAVNGVEQTIADEQTTPSGVTFSAPSTKGAGLSIGNIPAGQHKAIWIRRTISAGAAAYNTDSAVIKVEGDTAA